jgi:hypothetical protein
MDQQGRRIKGGTAVRDRILAMSCVALALLGGVVALGQQPGNPPLPSIPGAVQANPVPVGFQPVGLPPVGPVVPETLPPQPLPPSAATADPVETVEQFVERSRQEADEAIKALTQEREALRAQLQKVETALQRWHQVAEALKPSPPAATKEAAKTAIETVPPPYIGEAKK